MSNKRKITYKCPYCDKRFNKEDLVSHVGDKHDDMIPEGYSAFRLVFDYVNKKPAGYNGKCIICGNESGWNENKGKYNRICSNPVCKKKYIQSFEERMMKSKGVTRISSTAEGQAKMLANRKISGEYKFQDGGIRTYTGTYEKKALEFMDKVMNIQSIDVATPGPILEYDFEGKTHIYISDIYYAPYNLIIEVKDGGNNPNMRSMPEYRAKQIAKEKYIIKYTDYNYLRLTNNDFSQLLAVFMELKMEMSNDTPERVIRINEGVISDRLKYPYKYGEAKKINQELTNKINSTNYPWYFINITELINSGVDINLYGYDEEPVEGVDKPKYKSHHLYNKKVKVFHGRDSLNPSLRKYSKFNKGATKTKDVVLKEEYIEESNDELSFKSDKELLEWMKKNIKYSNFRKLKSHDEVLKTKSGSCHDQVMFEYEELKKLGYSPRGLFIIELDKNGQGGMTHSLVYYKKGNKICWFENAWKGQEGIGEHDSLNNIKDIIKDMYNNYGWGNIRKYGHLEFKTFSILSHKPGESLQQFVDICLDDSIKENYIEEGFLKSEPDILYNKEAFDNGDINICFITGLSGSGKSTMGKEYKNQGIDVVNMDILQNPADDWNSISDIKKYSELMYQFYNGPGKKYFVTWKYLVDNNIPGTEYEDKLFPDFIEFAKKYAKSHKDKKFICEGVYFFLRKSDGSGEPLFKPEQFKDYAFYIKGTSIIKSRWRSILRDSKYDFNKTDPYDNNADSDFTGFRRFINILKLTFKNDWKYYFTDEKCINKFRDYFKNKPETVLSEAYTGELGKIQKDPEIIDSYGFISSDGIYNENVKIKGFDKWLRGRSELLIIDKGKVYLKKDPKKGYSIPGGGWEKDEDHNLSAIRETNEEARIKVKNVNYVSSYVAYFPPKDWVKEKISEENWWYGEYIELYIGEYDGQYKGEVDKIDQDKAMESGKFYDIKSIYNDLIPVHQEALSDIVNESVLLEASISRYKKIKIDRSLIESDPIFKHLREDHCRGYAFYDKDKLVGFVNVEDKDGESWIQALEIMPDYRNQGLGKSILDIAVKELKANYLSVNKKNAVAISMYKKYGFKTYKETETMYFMSLKEELSEASISDYIFLDIKSNKSKALEYLKSSTQTKDYADDIVKNYVGEIVLYDNEMIGRIFVGDKKDKGFITDFEINEEHRGNKLGSKLIDDAIIKYHGIDLLVDKDNKIAINMYKKRGFIVIKTIKNQYWMKLKSEIKEDTNMTEAMNALMTGYIPGSVDNPNNVYIVNYMQNNVFSDEDPNEDCIGVSDNPKFTNLIVRDNTGMLKRVNESFLKDKTYKVYILEMSRDEVNKRLGKYLGGFVKKNFIYEALTGHKLYTKDQIQFESMFIPTVDYYEFMESFEEICDNYFQLKDKKVINTDESAFVPEEVKVFNKSGLVEIKKVHSMNDYISAKPSKVLEYLDISIKE